MIEENKADGPAVTVLMSCYNGSRWLPEAIESVLAQTLRDFELVLVDDGSKDRTLEIIREYAAKDPRITVLAKPNTGLADSLNSGLALAKGAWVARVDQDDICEPERLQKQLSYAITHPGLVLLGSGFSEINEAGEVVKKHNYPAGHHALTSRLERLQGFFPHSSAFYKTSAALKVGGYNRRFTRAEDRGLWLSLSLQGKVSCLPQPLVKIRKHSSQMSLDDGGIRQLCDSVATVVCHLLKKNGKEDPSVVLSNTKWEAFLAWLDTMVEKSGLISQRRAWWEARAVFLSCHNKWKGFLRFALTLLESGHVFDAVAMKLFGSSLPRAFADEWSRHNAEEHGRPT